MARWDGTAAAHQDGEYSSRKRFPTIRAVRLTRRATPWRTRSGYGAMFAKNSEGVLRRSMARAVPSKTAGIASHMTDRPLARRNLCAGRYARPHAT
jgi:hypothetical protein